MPSPKRCGHRSCGCRAGASCCLDCPLDDCVWQEGGGREAGVTNAVRDQRIRESPDPSRAAKEIGLSRRQYFRIMNPVPVRTLKETAQAHGVTVEAMRSPSKAHELVSARVCAAWSMSRRGVSVGAIASMLKRTEQTVYQTLNPRKGIMGHRSTWRNKNCGREHVG